MLDGLQAWHRPEMLIECGRRRACGLEQRAAQVKRGGFVADGVRFEAVASR